MSRKERISIFSAFPHIGKIALIGSVVGFIVRLILRQTIGHDIWDFSNPINIVGSAGLFIMAMSWLYSQVTEPGKLKDLGRKWNADLTPRQKEIERRNCLRDIEELGSKAPRYCLREYGGGV